MVNPIDHQLSYWKVEQNAETHKDPASAARQSFEAHVSENEANRRDSSVQAGEESRESQRAGVGERDARRHGKESSSEKKEKKEADDSGNTKDKKGLDLYA